MTEWTAACQAKMFISLWLCSVFVAAPAVSSCCEWGLFSGSGVRVSHCSGFSCCKAWAPVIVVCGLSSSGSEVPKISLICCGPWAQLPPQHVGSSQPWDGTSVLCIARLILTTGPPGKPPLPPPYTHFES